MLVLSKHPLGEKNLDAAGFTLIEVMVVIVILAIMAAMIVPKVMSRPDEARIVAARQDVASLAQAVKLYKLDNKQYPSTEQGLNVLTGKYLERMPIDPWGKPYQYLFPGLRGEFDIWSFGADGQPGGEGGNADIGSWAL
jgi:general secretion pathway protein G